jgi:hypothetical protein
LEVIKAKRIGEEIHSAADVEEEELPDLTTALRQSIERSKGSARRRRQTSTRKGKPARAGRSNDLSSLSKAELDKRAKGQASRAGER